MSTNTNATTSTPSTPRNRLWPSVALVLAGVVVGLIASACGSRPGVVGPIGQAQAEPAKADVAATKPPRWEYKSVLLPGPLEREKYDKAINENLDGNWELFQMNVAVAVYRRAK
jgi:hypothetical protein